MGRVNARLKTFPTEIHRSLAITTRNWTSSTFEVATIFQMPRSGVTLTTFRIVISGQAGAPPPNYQLTLEGVNTSGEPNGTDLAVAATGGNTNCSFTPSGTPTYTVDFEIGDDLGSGGVDNAHYAPDRGELLAIVLKYKSGGTTIDGSNNITINEHINVFDHFRPQIPYNVVGSSGSWAKGGGLPMMAVKGDDGRYYGGMLVQSVGGQSFNATTRQKQCNHFKLPTGSFNDLEVIGVSISDRYGTSKSADWDVGIWDSSGDEVAVWSNNAKQSWTNSSHYPRTYLFESSATLTAGTSYYVGYSRTATGSSGSLDNVVEVGQAADFSSWPGGQDIYKANWNGSSWDAVTNERIASMSLILGSATAPAAGVSADQFFSYSETPIVVPTIATPY